jgi:RNA polymerase sigma factor (sigma-70 family)
LPKPIKSDPRIAQYLPLCRSLAHQYLRKVAGQLDFDDLVSIGQIAVWRATLTYREDGGATFGTYVYQAVLHAMVAEQSRVWREGRRAWLKQTSLHPANDDDLGLDLPSPLPSPFTLLAAARDAKTVRAALARLTPRQRDVLRKLYFDDLDQVEVASINSRSKQAVQQLGVYALRALEGLLDEETRRPA